jgi:CBS domain-containing protein
MTARSGTQAFARTLVANVMIRQVKIVDEDASLVECARIMHTSKIGSLVVLENGNPLGIFTDRDLVRAVATVDKNAAVAAKVSEFMSRPLTTISPRATLMDAITMMGRLNIRHLLVVEDGRLVGILSARDLLFLILSSQDLKLERVSEDYSVTTREMIKGLTTVLQDY